MSVVMHYTLIKDGTVICEFRNHADAVCAYRTLLEIVYTTAHCQCFSAQLNAREHCAIFSQKDATVHLALKCVSK